MTNATATHSLTLSELKTLLPLLTQQYTPHHFISAYSPKLSPSITFPENSLYTKQEFREESDINTIMAQYMRTGELPQINEAYPEYMDATGHDFTSHMNFIAGANSMFAELPSAIRNRFDNDPAAFLDFASNESNRLELAQMGLLSSKATEAILTQRPPTNLPQNAAKTGTAISGSEAVPPLAPAS